MRICVLLLCAAALRAGNPGDIDFHLRLTKDPPIYHTGESIEFEISYASQAERKYRGSFTTPMPELDVVTLQLNPPDGFSDRRKAQWRYGFAGSILSGTGYLGPQPVTMRADLADWYRFEKPGHYTLSLTSNQVSRIKSPDAGGGEERLTLESEPVDLEILGQDPSWEAQELETIVRDLDGTTNLGERLAAKRRLARLDTPASVQQIVQRYLADSGIQEDDYYNRALRESSHAGLIIPLLEAALAAADGNPPSSLAGLLAELQAGNQPGATPAEFAKLYDEHLARNNAILMASIRNRTGRRRAAALYQVWWNAERQNGGREEPGMAQLRREVLASAADLRPPEQLQFLSLAWDKMPHQEMLPVVRSLTAGDTKDASPYLAEAFRFWCEEWPDDCAEAMLTHLLQPDTNIPPFVVLYMPEAARPEIDPMLRERLAEADMAQDSFRAQRTAALVLRAGSRNLRSSVDRLLARPTAGAGYACETRSYLFGYLFRVAPDDAAARMTAELMSRNDTCGSQLFRILSQARYSDDLIPLAVKALDSPNPGAAGTAALFLGEHGPASVEEVLWRRLNALWSLWSDRAAELRGALFEDDIRGPTALLEQELASALTHAHAWKLTAAEQESLRAGCLTGPCRDIADGKMSMGL